MTDQLVGSLEDLVESERRLCHVPGVAVAVTRNGQTLLSKGFGQRDLVDGPPVTARTVFPIASSTKAFTAAVVGTLVDDGVLAWDTPVREYIAGFRMWDPVATDLLTLRDMLSHRSGLPRHDLMWFGSQSSDRRDIVDALRHLQPSLAIREGWQYNNLMYLAAGSLIEQVTGASWEEAVRARILAPLGMDDSVFVLDSAKSGDVSQGHLRRDGVIGPMTYRSHRLVGPAGGVCSSADDLVRWLQANLGDGDRLDEQVISPANIAELHRPAMLMPPSVITWPEVPKVGYALGWEVHNYRGHRVVQHAGDLGGFSAMVTLLPDEDIGVAVLANMQDTPLRDILPYAIVDRLLELDALPWSKRYREIYDALAGGQGQGSERRHDTSVRAPFGRPLVEYEGAYRHPAYGAISVRVVADELVVGFGSLSLPVRHLHHEAFELVEDEEGLTIAGRFDSDFEGNVGAISLMLEPAVDPIAFERQPPAVDAQSLIRLTGAYRRGPVRAVVSHGGTGLLFAIGNLPAVRLVPRRDRVFAFEGQGVETVEFLLDAQGGPVGLITWSLGRFDFESVST